MREGFDFALTRAVAGIGVLAELTLPFCRTGGIVVVQKGPDIDEEIAGAHKAIETMGGRIMEVREVGVPELGDGKRLVVLEKVGPTPQMYPRAGWSPRETSPLNPRPHTSALFSLEAGILAEAGST